MALARTHRREDARLKKYRTREDDCTAPATLGAARPKHCEHGNRYLSEAELKPKERAPLRKVSEKRQREIVAGDRPRTGSTLKRTQPKRDWTLAIAKTQEENEMCRVCAAFGVECAHILGRRFDQPISPGSKTLLVLPDRIVPLCGRHGHECHRRYDEHQLDLLPLLTTAEQAQAVLDAGSIGKALNRISPEGARSAA